MHSIRNHFPNKKIISFILQNNLRQRITFTNIQLKIRQQSKSSFIKSLSQHFDKQMSQSHQLSSSIFEVDRESVQLDVNKHFFKADSTIVPEAKIKKVVFGQMEEQQRSIYQIVSPYMATVAKTTGNFAYEAGSIAYNYIKQGFWWFYDQLTNKVIPYTKQELPKLIFIISNKVSNQQQIKSGQFCVLSMEQEDFLEIDRKKRKQKQGPIQVLIALGQKDEALINEIKRNYQVSSSFPIDDSQNQDDHMSMTYYIPSQRFSVMEQTVKTIVRQRSRMIEVPSQKQDDQNKYQKSQNEKIENNAEIIERKNVEYQLKDMNLNKNEQVQIQEQKRKQSGDWQQVKQPELKQPTRKVILLPDACIFQYEQNDEMYPFIADLLENDETAVAGHLINSTKLQKKQSRNSQGSGEVPLLTVDNIGEKIIVKKQDQTHRMEEKLMPKVVDMERKVKVEINNIQQRHVERGQEQKLLN